MGLFEGLRGALKKPRVPFSFTYEKWHPLLLTLSKSGFRARCPKLKPVFNTLLTWELTIEDCILVGLLYRWSALERDCYDEGELTLAHLPPFYGYRYSMGNCWFDHVLHAVEEVCQCQHWDYQIPAELYTNSFPNTTAILPICNRSSPQDIACIKKQFSRGQNDVYKQAGVNGVLGDNKCLPSCEDQKLGSVSVTTAPINFRHPSVLLSHTICLLAKRWAGLCERRPISRTNHVDWELSFAVCSLLERELDEIDLQMDCNDANTRVKFEGLSNFPVIRSYAKDSLVHFNVYFTDHFAIRNIKRSKLSKDKNEL